MSPARGICNVAVSVSRHLLMSVCSAVDTWLLSVASLIFIKVRMLCAIEITSYIIWGAEGI